MKQNTSIENILYHIIAIVMAVLVFSIYLLCNQDKVIIYPEHDIIYLSAPSTINNTIEIK